MSPPLHSRSLRWLILLGAIAILAGAYFAWGRQRSEAHYVTAPVTRGSVTRTINTTGTVDPVVTVEVGAYVSGTIQALYCDYNTPVKAGQLCAKIDPRPYEVIVDEDTANVETARAQLKKDNASLAYAKIAYQRDQRLRPRGVVSADALDSDRSLYDQDLAQIELDKATINQRQAALKSAKVNLAYTDIVSPVDGTVVSRNVSVGQTVAASFQTPTLFLIAKDLTKMQIDTNVSESDIGAAKDGQNASFTVEAYPKRTFWGRITQVRKAPITVQNVVTYDVVVSVDNDDLALLPGMTANVRIITAERHDVVRVPVKALRFTPGGIQKAGDRTGKAGEGIYALRGERLRRIPIRVGLRDGKEAEVLSGDLKPGDDVVIDEAGAGARSGRGSTHPRRHFFHL